jgi:hypothetical protein
LKVIRKDEIRPSVAVFVFVFVALARQEVVRELLRLRQRENPEMGGAERVVGTLTGQRDILRPPTGERGARREVVRISEPIWAGTAGKNGPSWAEM